VVTVIINIEYKNKNESVLTIDPIAGESKNIIKAKKLNTRPASETVISFFSA